MCVLLLLSLLLRCVADVVFVVVVGIVVVIGITIPDTNVNPILDFPSAVAKIPFQDAKHGGMAVPDRSTSVKVELGHDGCDLASRAKYIQYEGKHSRFSITELPLHNFTSSTQTVYARLTKPLHDQPNKTHTHWSQATFGPQLGISTEPQTVQHATLNAMK
jgi:hypothetical protein